MFGEDYHDKFDPQSYLQMYYFGASDPVRLFLVKQVHEYYHSYKSTASKLRILDVGTGPVIAHTISAAPHASEIVLSEYSEANREALLQWLKNDPKSHDWTPFFKHVVVDLEGKSEEEVPTRAELVRKVVKAVVPCDVNSDSPIPPEYVDQYDIVTDFFCLVSACATKEDYVAALIRLCALIKPGGTIMLYTCESKPHIPYAESTYSVGSQKFLDRYLSKEFVSKSLEQVGFCDVKIVSLTRQELQIPEDQQPECLGTIFITACKKPASGQ